MKVEHTLSGVIKYSDLLEAELASDDEKIVDMKTKIAVCNANRDTLKQLGDWFNEVMSDLPKTEVKWGIDPRTQLPIPKLVNDLPDNIVTLYNLRWQ